MARPVHCAPGDARIAHRGWGVPPIPSLTLPGIPVLANALRDKLLSQDPSIHQWKCGNTNTNQHPFPSRGQAAPPFPKWQGPELPLARCWLAKPRGGPGLAAGSRPSFGEWAWDCDHAPVYKGAAVSRIPGFVPACCHLSSPTTAPDVSCACRGLFLAQRPRG